MRRSSRKCLAVFVLFLALACGQARASEVEDRDALAEAFVHWRNGNVLHLAGRYEQAAELFQQSIDAYPTAEGHTFLGWSLSELGRLEDAIAECKKAISLDSDYGNPYNDIGVYLIQLGRSAEAVPWLHKAIAARRYCCYEFAHANLGRVLLSQGKIDAAKRSFERALSHNPAYVPAIAGLAFIREHWGEDL
jgi:Tfp pilus assembly protein PilF